MADLASPDRHITAKDMECLKEAFALFDRDRDGEINTEELGKVYHLKIAVAESNGICTKINQNPDSFKILMEKSKAYIQLHRHHLGIAFLLLILYIIHYIV